MSRRQIKSFSVQQFFKNAAKVWASSPHLRSKFYWYPICNLFSLLQSHIFKLSRSNLENQGETKAKIQAGQRGDCSTLAGKSRGGTPFCRTLKTVFSKRSSLLGIPPESDSARLGHIPSLPWESQLPLKPCFSLQPLDLKGNCDSYDSLLDFCFRLLCSFICSANVGYSPTPRQYF